MDNQLLEKLLHLAAKEIKPTYTIKDEFRDNKYIVRVKKISGRLVPLHVPGSGDFSHVEVTVEMIFKKGSKLNGKPFTMQHTLSNHSELMVFRSLGIREIIEKYLKVGRFRTTHIKGEFSYEF